MKKKIILMIYFIHIFLIISVYGKISTKSPHKTLLKGKRVIQACVTSDWIECGNKLKVRLSNDTVAYQQLKLIDSFARFPMMAAREGCTELIDVLLNSGANIDQCFLLNNTMLHFASRYGHFDTVRLLLTHGANVSVTEWSGDTALHKSARMGHVNVTELLLRYGSDINAKNENGDTPLHLAVYYEHNAVIECLIKHGCDKSIENNWGSTALKIAKMHGNTVIVKQLSSKW